MAWEIVNYSCGHSERVQFYGPTKERARRKEWMENGLCKECYKKAMLEKTMNDDSPVKINLFLSTANLSSNGKIIINAVAEGGTYREKDNLKKLGFCFGDVPMSGLFGIFERSRKAWYKIIEIDTIDQIAESIKFGNYEVVSNISEVDIAAMKNKIMAISSANKTKKEADDEVGKSPLRVWLESNYKDAYWNGKIYGENEKYNKPGCVYLDGKKTDIPSDVYSEQIKWRERRKEIYAKYGISD